jgi:serine/threonine-protein kinase RsbW
MQVSKKILIPNRLSSLHHIRRGVRLFVRSHVNENWEFKLVLVIDEAISNIIEHGFPNHIKSKIELNMELKEWGFSFTILDKGVQFDPTIKFNTIFEKTPHIKTDGFGLLLLYSIIKITYMSGKDKENILILEKPFSEMD